MTEFLKGSAGWLARPVYSFSLSIWCISHITI